VRVTFDPPPGFARLPDAFEMALFRVVQESLGNILRHARTLAARIRLGADAEQVTLEISDSGVGMSAKTLRAIQAEQAAPGVGIAGMRERLRLVGGRLEIKSSKRGTSVRAIIPRIQSVTQTYNGNS
jgi:signal transduction histidine kinase